MTLASSQVILQRRDYYQADDRSVRPHMYHHGFCLSIPAQRNEPSSHGPQGIGHVQILGLSAATSVIVKGSFTGKGEYDLSTFQNTLSNRQPLPPRYQLVRCPAFV
jgi:hypothetical protein